MYVRRSACGVIFGSGGRPRAALISCSRLTTGARTRSRTLSLSRERPAAVGNTNASTPSGVDCARQLSSSSTQVEAEVDLPDTGVRLRLLDHEPLVVDVDRTPAQLAHLAHPEPGFRHHCDHRLPSDPPIATRSTVELRSCREQLSELVGFEKPSRRPRGFEPPAFSARRVAGEQLILDRRVEDVRQEHERC
jgi:hypothetical protein